MKKCRVIIGFVPLLILFALGAIVWFVVKFFMFGYNFYSFKGNKNAN